MGYSRPTIGELRDPGENTAFAWLLVLSVLALLGLTISTFGVALITLGAFALLRLMAELFLAAYIKVNAVRVSETQLPEVYNAARACCDRLNIPIPEVYVLQDSVWNALAMRVVGTRMVVLLSGAVDSLLLKGEPQQLTWLVGHEIGHHVAGHLGFWRGGFVALGAWLPWVYLWYRRRGEFTCDRVGLFCSANLQTALLAMANMAVGAQLADRVDVTEAIRQWQRHKSEFFVRYRTIYSTHPHHLWRFHEMTKAAVALGTPGSDMARAFA